MWKEGFFVCLTVHAMGVELIGGWKAMSLKATLTSEVEFFFKWHLFHKFSCSSGITASLGNTSIFSLARCLSGKPDTRWASSPPLVWSVHFLAFFMRLLSPSVLVWSVVNAVMVLGTYLWKAICLFPEKQAREDTYSPRVVQQGRKEKGVGWENQWTPALDSEDLGPGPTI